MFEAVPAAPDGLLEDEVFGRPSPGVAMGRLVVELERSLVAAVLFKPDGIERLGDCSCSRWPVEPVNDFLMGLFSSGVAEPSFEATATDLLEAADNMSERFAMKWEDSRYSWRIDKACSTAKSAA